MNIESSQQKRTIYTIILICIIAAGALLWISTFQKQTTPKSIISSQDILSKVISFQTPKTWTEEEKNQLLEELENSFNEQCSDISSTPSETCFPFVIYSYISTKEHLGIPPEETHTEVSSKALNLWKDYYKNVEFNKEGFVIGETPTLLNSITQYYYFMATLPLSEKGVWFEKVSGVSPTEISMRHHLLRIYLDQFNIFKVSQFPEGGITQEEIENLCHNLPMIGEDWGACEVLYYFNIKNFCEEEITDQEITMAQEKIETETQEPDLQDCKIGLQNLINTQFS